MHPPMKPHELIRNFSIIAHIDHGKSTLADRILEKTGALSQREMTDQVLDSMDLERERGITIKARAVRLRYKAKDGQTYQLNLIDTPGHVDFSYEVSRSLAACEGALLVVDAAQGVEAQTLANAYLAINGNLALVPVINKIDLPAADPDRVKEQIENVVGIEAHDAVLTSAKAGIGIEEVLERVVRDIPAPEGDPEAPLKALVFDSWYDPYRGVGCLVRVFEGTFSFEPESSTALGFGFRCGFLGLLHMEIIQARLEREFDLDLITTAPGVRYRVHTTDRAVTEIESPSKLPDAGRIDYLEEPYIRSTILSRAEYVGGILGLNEERRGERRK